MFVKRRKVANFNNNDMLENKNYPMPLSINQNNNNSNNKKLTKFCLQHFNNCTGNTEEVKNF